MTGCGAERSPTPESVTHSSGNTRYDAVLTVANRHVRLPSQHYELLAFPICTTNKAVGPHSNPLLERSCSHYKWSGKPVACANRADDSKIAVPVIHLPTTAASARAILRFRSRPDESVTLLTYDAGGGALPPQGPVGLRPHERISLTLQPSKLVVIDTTYFSPKINPDQPPAHPGRVLSLHYEYYFCTG